MLARSGVVPYVGHHVLYPAFGILSVEVFCTLLSAWYQPERKVYQGFMEFRKVSGFCYPVIHLDIYVGVIVSVPRSMEGVCPKALEIRRQVAGACAAYEKISAVVIIEGSQ